MSRRANNLAHALCLCSVEMVLEGLRHGVAVLVQGVDNQTVADSVRRWNEG